MLKTGTQIAALILFGALLGCTGPGRLYVRVGPPAPVVETSALAPGPGYVWIGGLYRWNGREYVWLPGRWERPPQRRAVWVPGHWVNTRRGWYFVDGHWR